MERGKPPFQPDVRRPGSADEADRTGSGPEHPGGLLFGVAPEDAGKVRDGFKRRGETCWEIGEVTTEIGIAVR